MTVVSALFLAFAAATAPAQAAAPATAPQQVAPARAAAERRLADLMSPRDLMVATEMRNFDAHIREAVLNGQSPADYDGDYPGLLDAVLSATRPVVEKAAEKDAAELQHRIAELLARRFTDAEISELTQFYGSSAGRSIVREMAGASDAGALYRQAAEDPDAQVTTEQVSSQVRNAATKATKLLSDADRAALLAMMKRPVFVKLAEVQPELIKILAAETNREDPELEAEISDALEKAMAAHMAKIDAERAPKE